MDDGLTLGQAPGYDTDHVDQRRADEIIRSHVRAFNARDLEGLLRTLADDAVWTTGRTTVHSRADLAAFFQGAMTGLDATLSIRTLVTAGSTAAAELTETFGSAGAVALAGFYDLADGTMTRARIYREGSADPD